MRKRLLLVLVLCLCAIVCTGCNNNESSASQISKEHATEIIRCFNENDSESLKNMFCGYISDTHNLDEEINIAFEFIDGEIIDNGDWSGMSEAGLSIRDGKTESLRIQPDMKNITTSSEKKYTIEYNEYIINTITAGYVGITRITIINENGDKAIIGEIIQA